MKELLTVIAAISIILGILGVLIVLADIRNGHRQRMPVMETVWPLTALWGSWAGVLIYFRFGRQHRPSPTDELMNMDMRPQRAVPPPSEEMPGMSDMKRTPGSTDNINTARPEWISVLHSTLHCGAGCVLADLLCELLFLFAPITIAGSTIAGLWTLEYILALILGIGFQYAAMQQMHRSPVGPTVKRALKADFLSLTAWQAGMYGWMALTLFVFFPDGLGRDTWTFWFMMQLAMFTGLAVSYPVNRWLLRIGLKHAM
ncbi:DUF4396 domain-containing protein [uncultured Rikenella sp.]|uniref:DUF4396 domain-containing protein n=1 Tax=uncultured Rikenella sp. TaxID=368003 RepID=UPI002611843F|nr:DUF4396 domain-containing protein [uncultured Rikenella sp.]